MSSIMEWAYQENDSTLLELLPDGEFIYSRESAEKWLKLLERWKQDTNN